jgi:hypothetical protein
LQISFFNRRAEMRFVAPLGVLLWLTLLELRISLGSLDNSNLDQVEAHARFAKQIALVDLFWNVMKWMFAIAAGIWSVTPMLLDYWPLQGVMTR